MKLSEVLKVIKDSLDSSKEYNLTKKGKKFILEEVSKVDKKVWTKEQEKYLDERFGKVEQRLDNLEKDMSAVKTDTKLIIDILSRNGMK